MFPFAYDVAQFNACLIVQTLKDNLEAITDRVYDRSYQRIVLDKLYQVTTHTRTLLQLRCQSQCCHRDAMCFPPLTGVSWRTARRGAAGFRLHLPHGHTWWCQKVEREEDRHTLVSDEHTQWRLGRRNGTVCVCVCESSQLTCCKNVLVTFPLCYEKVL